MATAQSILIEAVRRIAGIPPETLALLRQIQKRGGIDGIKTELGGDGGTGAEEDCCSDPNNPGNDPCVRQPNSIWCNPDPDDPWKDCETGQPIEFTPGGFPRPESCKECAEDPDWEEGYYYRNATWLYGSAKQYFYGATPAEVCAQAPSSLRIIPYGWFDKTGCLSYTIRETGQVFDLEITKHECGSSTADYCQITEPPEKCGDKWDSDGITSYTVFAGCIVASSCDPDASASSKQCNDCIQICNSAGEKITICATPDGGFTATDRFGDGTKYDRNGNVQYTF
jgi:hypothetical protein